ncbi:protein IQ-DOMAIN 14-like isoform X1 [Cucurbita pepo subsp. pepo]|uniref:protein IQ-DOMAIN 14-like isoform X1 n=1 Tax=Cucurbita pepo subsp. pepo TaxID=3664 RepID=UPI000C9D4B8B|nr:protein IQ-DOMAIN 14-like isoform X1 [Cucurbita pepo subsp. pepo]XP_023539706.1 protein IQ-DOMAIN 14-like isoform X1 [Cucurbita pepo subsp. pepo]
MGKKGRWFSVLKRFFTCHSGEKDDRRNERKGNGKGESTSSFIPIFRKPSSVEKIFSDFEREQRIVAFQPPTPELPSTPSHVPPRPASPPAPSPPRAPPPNEPSPKISPPRVASPPRACSSIIANHHEEVCDVPIVINDHEEARDIPSVVNHHEEVSNIPAVVNHHREEVSPAVVNHHHKEVSNIPAVVNHHREEVSYVPEPTANHLSSAIKIQATYRGYVARKSFRALKCLVRLQGIVQGNNVRRQTLNAKKQMQLLVRVQSQIQSRRIEMIENERQLQDHHNDKEAHSTFDASEGGNHENWDESSLTKEEKDARLQRKVEAAIKRERARAYAYSQSHQRTTPRFGQDAQIGTCSMGVPRWLKWLEGQLPTEAPPKHPLPRPVTPQLEQKSSPRTPSSNNRRPSFGLDGRDTPTPKSTKATPFSNSRPAWSPHWSRTPPTARSNVSSDSRSRGRRVLTPFEMRLKDDDSLVSCPPYMAPHYMTPTISAKAKVRAHSNPRERFPGTPRSEASSRRQSFPPTQGVGSFRNRGLMSPRTEQAALDDNQSLRSVGFSIASTPTGNRRKPFNRFV